MVMISSGIFADAECYKSPKFHMFMVVGYGSENGTDFWILKNSWGIQVTYSCEALISYGHSLRSVG